MTLQRDTEFDQPEGGVVIPFAPVRARRLAADEGGVETTWDPLAADTEDLLTSFSAADAEALAAEYHHQRGTFLVAIGRLHLVLHEVATAFFDGDKGEAAKFLHTLSHDEPFAPGTIEHALCDGLCRAIMEGAVTIASEPAAVLQVLAHQIPARDSL